MKNVKSNIKLFITAIGIIAVWRGVWGIFDLYLFPNDHLISFLISIIIGILILYFHDHKLNELL